MQHHLEGHRENAHEERTDSSLELGISMFPTETELEELQTLVAREYNLSTTI